VAARYIGKCFCEAVSFEAFGEAAVQGYCHCNDCRRWLGAPVNAFTLWSPEKLRIIGGKEQLASFSKSPSAVRMFCKTCGGGLMTDHPGLGLVDVLSSVLPEFPYVPTLHVNYASRSLEMRDSLPKFRDLPANFGGSGEMIPD
jgi:hypothetical protein